jgi:hypothetical protein
MINGTGKQAIKNTPAPVTNFLGRSSVFASEADHCAMNPARTPPKPGRWRVSGGEIDNPRPEWGAAETKR